MHRTQNAKQLQLKKDNVLWVELRSWWTKLWTGTLGWQRSETCARWKCCSIFFISKKIYIRQYTFNTAVYHSISYIYTPVSSLEPQRPDPLVPTNQSIPRLGFSHEALGTNLSPPGPAAPAPLQPPWWSRRSSARSSGRFRRWWHSLCKAAKRGMPRTGLGSFARGAAALRSPLRQWLQGVSWQLPRPGSSTAGCPVRSLLPPQHSHHRLGLDCRKRCHFDDKHMARHSFDERCNRQSHFISSAITIFREACIFCQKHIFYKKPSTHFNSRATLYAACRLWMCSLKSRCNDAQLLYTWYGCMTDSRGRKAKSCWKSTCSAKPLLCNFRCSLLCLSSCCFWKVNRSESLISTPHVSNQAIHSMQVFKSSWGPSNNTTLIIGFTIWCETKRNRGICSSGGNLMSIIYSRSKHIRYTYSVWSYLTYIHCRRVHMHTYALKQICLHDCIIFISLLHSFIYTIQCSYVFITNRYDMVWL